MATGTLKSRSLSGMLALALLLASCASVNSVGPGEVTVGKSYKVSTSEIWTRYPKQSRTNREATWTIDGGLLNSLEFVEGLKDGDSIIYTGSREKLIPKYRSDMTVNELAEFVLDSYEAIGLANAELVSLRPEPFGTEAGYRLDFSGAYQNGLNLTGTAKMTQRAGKLYLIIFYAPSEYYYGLREEEVDAILQSVQLM